MTIDPYAGKYSDLALLNVYAYGNNNPMLYVDPDGEWAFLVPMAINGVVNVAATALFSDEPLTWGKAGSAFVAGAIGGPAGKLAKAGYTGGKVILGEAIEIGTGALVGGFTQSTLDQVDNWEHGKGFSWSGIFVNGMNNTVGNIGGGLASKGVSNWFGKAMPDVNPDVFLSTPALAGGFGYSVTTHTMNTIYDWFIKDKSILNNKLFSKEEREELLK